MLPTKKQLLQIQNKGAIQQILGGLLKNPNLLIDSNYYILPTDFPETFHSLLFSSINNLYTTGTVVMDIPTICNYLYTMPTQYKIFEANNGAEYIEYVKEHADLKNFDSNYKLMKKFSVLRDLCSEGQDITDIFDYNETDPTRIEEMNKAIFKLSMTDILDHYRIKFNDVASKYEMEDIGITKAKGSERVREVIQSFKESPDFGARFYNEWYNTAFRGARLRKFYLETAGSGCVDKDTEFFTGIEWKKISEYTKGDMVLQYDMDTQVATLTYPERYIKAPCDYFNEIKTKYGLDQLICDEHNMVVRNLSRKPKIVKIPFKEFKERHETSKKGVTLTIPTAFYYNGSGIERLTNEQIRLQIAVMAYGSYREDCRATWCRINLKKEDKKIRLRQLLNDCKVDYKEGDKEDEYTVFKFDAPIPNIKHFPKEWYNATREQLEVICDEVFRWNADLKENNRYFSTCKEDADFVQFVCSSLGIRATLAEYDRIGKDYLINGEAYQRKSKEYTVYKSSHSCFVSMTQGVGEKLEIGRVKSEDGFKYCFTVDKGALVLRRNGKVFVSGNCGKSRRQIRESIFMGIPYIYDSSKGKWVNTGIAPQKTTYICTELEEDEIIPIAIAFLSEVDEEKIKYNTLTKEEEERVEKAIQLMEEYDNFHFVTISDFDVDDIQKIILDKILKENCKYFFFDYIHSTAKSLSFYTRKTGLRGLQEHQILFLMAVSLKAMCQRHNIFLYSATQMNSSGMSGESRDEQALRGSKAIADKIDAGVVLSRANKQDEENLKEIIQGGFGVTPNYVTCIYKNRGGRIRGYYLWSIFDLGTMREQFLFATNEKYEPITFKFIDYDFETISEEEVISGFKEIEEAF